MKQLALVLAVLLLAGCGGARVGGAEPSPYEEVNALPGVVLEVRENSLTATGLTLVVKNQSGTDLTFGSFYALERRGAEGWLQIPYLEQEHDVGWTGEGYEVLAGQSHTFDPVGWEWLYGPLEPGEYRIVKDGVEGRGGEITVYYFAAAFTLDGTEPAQPAPEPEDPPEEPGEEPEEQDPWPQEEPKVAERIYDARTGRLDFTELSFGCTVPPEAMERMSFDHWYVAVPSEIEGADHQHTIHHLSVSYLAESGPRHIFGLSRWEAEEWDLPERAYGPLPAEVARGGGWVVLHGPAVLAADNPDDRGEREEMWAFIDRYEAGIVGSITVVA